MMPSSVQIREITSENARELAADASGLNLGNHEREQQVEALLAKIRLGKKILLLDWEGSKVPRGVSIGLGSDTVIAWTQHGRVVSEGRADIGTYQRTIEFGGASGQHQQMLIYVAG